MSENPKVSVIVPVYNVENYLSECLNSIINQTLKEIEIICINDGSTDNSLNILKEFEKKDSRIIVIDKENEGYGKTMNLGLSMAKGEYAGFVESDDWVNRSMFSTLYENAVRNPKINIIKGSFMKISDTDDTRRVISFKELGFIKRNVGKVKISRNVPVMTMESSIWSAIYKRSFLEKYSIKFIETKGASYQDAIFKFMTYANCKEILLVDKPFYNYRELRADSSSANDKNPLIMFTNYEYLIKYLKSRNKFEKYYDALITHYLYDAVFHAKRLSPNEKNLYKFLYKLNSFNKYIGVKNLILIQNRLANPDIDTVLNTSNYMSKPSMKFKKKLKYTIIWLLKQSHICSYLLQIQNFINRIIDISSKANKSSNYHNIDLISVPYFQKLRQNTYNKNKKILLFTPFLDKDGTSTYIKTIINVLKDNRVDVLTYNESIQPNTININRHFHIFPKNRLVNNLQILNKKNNYNYKLDDWCDDDLLDSIKLLLKYRKYDAVIVNYVTFSKILMLFPKNFRKKLITHDIYHNLNIKKLKNNVKELWYSISKDGEKKGLSRANVIISVSKKETNVLKKLLNNKSIKIITAIPPLLNKDLKTKINISNKKLVIGSISSNHSMNYYSISRFLFELVKDNELIKKVKIIVAGSGSKYLYEGLKGMDNKTLKKIDKEFLGALNNLDNFYKKIDLAINPDFFSSGLKIKSIEAISYHKPLLTSRAANDGLKSPYNFHNFNTNKEMIKYIKDIVTDRNKLVNLIEASENLSNRIKNEYEIAKLQLKNYIES